MNIIITGGLGYIGSHTVIELVSNGYQPIIIDNLSNSDISIIERIKSIIGYKPDFYNIDVRDYHSLNEIIKSYDKIDGIIHFAAFKSVSESVRKPITYYDNNLNSLMNVLNIMEENNIQLFVFSSSCTVYGQPHNLPVSEDSPIQIAWSPYGNTKQISEEIIRDYINSGKNIKSIALRYFNPVGAHQSGKIGELPNGIPNNLLPYLTQTAFGIREKLLVYGSDYNTPDGTAIRDYIHVCDLADAHIKALEFLKDIDKTYYDTFNIGTGKGFSVLDVINSAQKFVDHKINYELTNRREGDVEQIWSSPTKANRVLKWHSKYGLDDMTKTALDWERHLRGL
ncbi:MAG TPA: UDP-glucose 4-epimerase GalE [Candidatus Kapabacteria bacterium]|nr:UDP-glucose 4-epimerase GalE [Candidatus Kapabacteria bacterium]